jgi:hypothetical protein
MRILATPSTLCLLTLIHQQPNKMRTTTLMLAITATAIGVLLPVADAQNGTATTACLDCTSFNQQQCEANSGDGECVWSGRSDADKKCIVDGGEGCKGCGCNPEGGSAGLIFVGVVLLIIIGACVACCMGKKAR